MKELLRKLDLRRQDLLVQHNVYQSSYQSDNMKRDLWAMNDTSSKLEMIDEIIEMINQEKLYRSSDNGNTFEEYFPDTDIDFSKDGADSILRDDIDSELCPRCFNTIDRPTALSRRDNKTNICYQCGIDEAFIDGRLLEPDEKELNFVNKLFGKK